MNGTDLHTPELQEGDVLQIRFETVKGELYMEIKAPNGTTIYRGPKQQPFIRKAHRYRFCVYGLDCALELPSTSRKKDLVQAMSGHILQTGEITGWYQP